METHAAFNSSIYAFVRIQRFNVPYSPKWGEFCWLLDFTAAFDWFFNVAYGCIEYRMMSFEMAEEKLWDVESCEIDDDIHEGTPNSPKSESKCEHDSKNMLQDKGGIKEHDKKRFIDEIR